MRQTSTIPAPIARTVPDDLQEAGHEYFPDLVAVDPVAGHPAIVKVTTPTGSWRVRRVPQGMSASDVAFSHDVMATAREAGLGCVPRLIAPPRDPPRPALSLGSRFYDAQGWLPGAPPPRSEAAWPDPGDRIDIPVVLSPAAFADVISAMARLHAATTVMAERRDIPAAPLDMLPGAVRQAHGRHLAALRRRARREPAIQRWLATGERIMANAEPIVLAAAQDQPVPASVLHLGLWPAHVLFDGETLSGILGWERVAAGSPLLDLAQATIRLQGWSDEAVEMALAIYADLRCLSPEERRLLPAVAALDAAATTGRLLEQTYAGEETARPPSALRAAIDMMLGSMTALDRNLIAQSTASRSRRTPWRRGPRPTPKREGGKPRARRC